MKALAIQVEAATWETAVVSVEIFCAMAASLFMMYRKVNRDVLVLSGDHHTYLALSPLIQPRGWWTLPALLAYRVAVILFYVVVQLYDIYRTSGKCMIFYTSWNFILQGMYFVFAAKRTHAIYTHQDEEPADYAALLDESASFLRTHTLAGAARRGWHRLDLVLDVCLATSVLISAVVWTILYPYADKTGHPETILNWVSYCQHAINLMLLQIDFAATQHSVSFDALPLIIAWPTAYCIFAWIVHGTIKHGFWPYPFLKLDTPWAPLWYGGLLFAHLVAFIGMLALSKLKHRYQESLRQSDYNTGATGIKQRGDHDGSSDELLSPRASDPHGHF
jgi:hypothetical protein